MFRTAKAILSLVENTAVRGNNITGNLLGAGELKSRQFKKNVAVEIVKESSEQERSLTDEEKSAVADLLASVA